MAGRFFYQCIGSTVARLQDWIKGDSDSSFARVHRAVAQALMFIGALSQCCDACASSLGAAAGDASVILRPKSMREATCQATPHLLKAMRVTSPACRVSKSRPADRARGGSPVAPGWSGDTGRRRAPAGTSWGEVPDPGGKPRGGEKRRHRAVLLPPY